MKNEKEDLQLAVEIRCNKEREKRQALSEDELITTELSA